MEIIRIEQKDLKKELRVGDKIVALSGQELPGPYEVISLHPGRAMVKELAYPQLDNATLFYEANKSVTVERADSQED